MLTRLLLILALAWQPLAIAAAATGHGAHAQQGGCCEIVERTTCCGAKVVERICAMGEGDCLCAVSRGDDQPTREAPMPRPAPEAVPAAEPDQGLVTEPASDASPTLRRAAVLVSPPRSHNEARAVLGVWRT